MADVAPHGEVAPHAAIAALARLVLDYRIVTLAIASAALPFQDGDPVVDLPLLLLALGAANLLPVLAWNRVSPFLMRHPLVLAADYLVTLSVLLVTGVDGPLLFYALGTAFLAGVLYGRRGAAVFAVLLVVGYAYALLNGPASALMGFQALVGMPSLFVLLVAGAAGVRALLVRQAQVEAELVTARTEAATAQERARLARELHDSLGKTLYGMVLLAGALPHWLERDPARAAREARALSAAAESAAEQARELLHGLRADRLELPLHEAARGFVGTWSQQTGVDAELEVEPVPGVVPEVRYELFWILREALRNVERHAAAGRVRIGLHVMDGEVELTVADDGLGLGEPDLEGLAMGGHFGLLGMRERAQHVGGELTVDQRHPRGTRVSARVPLPGAAAAPSPPRARSHA